MPALRNSSDRYGLVARVLHWTIGVLIVGQLALGFTVFEFMAKGAQRSALGGIHIGLGVTLLMLMVVRLAWRLYDRPPPFPPQMPPLEQQGARFGHLGLYLVLFTLVVSGWLMRNAGGGPASWFGVFNLPIVIGKDEGLKDFLEDFHAVVAYALIALVVTHAGLALWHKSVRKDGIADRML